jgi:hypothetical protein
LEPRSPENFLPANGQLDPENRGEFFPKFETKSTIFVRTLSLVEFFKKRRLSNLQCGRIAPFGSLGFAEGSSRSTRNHGDLERAKRW